MQTSPPRRDSGTRRAVARILVVDDDDECRCVVRELLEADGFVVNEASNGVGALRSMLSVGKPALVVLDLEMPAMSGCELVKQMAVHQDLARVPVLVLSGSQGDAVRRQPAVVAFVPKPLKVHDFLAKVRDCLCGKRSGSVPA